MIPFTILADKSQRLDYNLENFPLFVKSNNQLNHYGYDYKEYYHYHPDIEFSYTVSGSQDMFINGNYVHIPEGEGIFINSNRMHYGFSEKQNNCIFHVITVHPSLFNNAADAIKDYTNHRFSISNVDYILLSPNVPWQKTIIDKMLDIIVEMDKEDRSLFQLLAKTNVLCADICDHIEPVKSCEKERHIQSEYLKMVEYIKNNYQHKITVDDIAKAGAVSLRKCYRLFQQFVQQSPNVYLTKYRLMKSVELLRDTELSITDIALICGFQTASYYANVFKQELNTSPLQYRKQFRQE